MSYAPTLRGMLDIGSVQTSSVGLFSCFRFGFMLTIRIYIRFLYYYLFFHDCSLCMLLIDHRGLFEGSQYPHSLVTSWP